MNDLIERQVAENAICNACGKIDCDQMDTCEKLKLPPAQPEKRTEEHTETHACDLISRQAAIDAVRELYIQSPKINNDIVYDTAIDQAHDALANLPSAQPTLHGYNIEHLELIARVLQKENLPPERVVEALTDIGRIVAIVSDEFNETLRKAVEQCMT